MTLREFLNPWVSEETQESGEDGPNGIGSCRFKQFYGFGLPDGHLVASLFRLEIINIRVMMNEHTLSMVYKEQLIRNKN